MSDLPQENILDEIMGRDPAYSPEPADQRPPSGDAPDDGAETAGPAPEGKVPAGEKRSKPSSVYIYLAVLFGAAFLMLLLAYFVQRRNSATVQDNLRMITATKEELMENIRALEAEKSDLLRANGRLKYEAGLAEEGYEREKRYAADSGQELSEVRSRLADTVVLSYLERFINEKDYLMAACVSEACDNYFNEHNGIYYGNSFHPIQAARYMELRDWLVDNGHVDIVQYFKEDGSEYTEMAAVHTALSNGVSEETRATINAARDLWLIFWYYYDAPYLCSQLTAKFCHPDIGNLERLNTTTFRPSTIALFEQIKADLIARELLVEEDGILKAVVEGLVIDPVSAGPVSADPRAYFPSGT